MEIDVDKELDEYWCDATHDDKTYCNKHVN